MSMGTWAAIFIAIFCGVISSNSKLKNSHNENG